MSIKRRPFVTLAGHLTVALSVLHAGAPAAAQSQPAASSTPRPAANSQPAPVTRSALSSTLQRQFQTLDANKDNFVSQAEIAAGMLARQNQMVAEMRRRRLAAFTAMDKNKDRQISQDEFLAGGPQINTPAPNGSAIMGRMDANKDGKLTFAEYSALVLGNFDRLDVNRDGTISPDERRRSGTKP